MSLQDILPLGRRPAAPFGRDAEPIRAELFSIERLEQYAESLAASQRVTADPRRGMPVGPRLRENGQVLLEAYRTIAATIREERAITPAAEWLVDNFHIVEEQLREIWDDLPPRFYRELPKLAEGDLRGYPRVFGLTWGYVAHTDSRFDLETLRRFVRAYQRGQALNIGELWAVAITLRVVLVENLRRLAERIVRGRLARQEADAAVDSLLGLGGRAAEPTEAILRRFERAPLAPAFAAQLVQRLRDYDPAVTPILAWLSARLAAQQTTADEIIRVEHQDQEASNVTVRNVITSMRLISEVDWTEFFESVSLVDDVLRSESDFEAMDFATRDRYRHAIEELSRGSRSSELEVAQRAIARAKEARQREAKADDPLDERAADPGYFLVANGREPFEKELGYAAPMTTVVRRVYIAAATPGYLGSVLLVSGVILALPLLDAAHAGAGVAGVLFLGLIGLFPASDLAIALVNRYVLAVVPPRVLPRLDLRDGVPSNLRTMVVVPTLLANRSDIQEQIARLEVHYLANPEGDLRFAVLSDWTDAPSKYMPDDDELLTAAADSVQRLNERHGPVAAGGERFFLLHRHRVWNAGEGRWIGWERKRGKLHELNRLLRGASDTTFLPVGGGLPKVPSDVRFVITLDADTRLPSGAAYALVGTIAHPLNRPRFDRRLGRVTEGYGVLQPRITPTLPVDHESSWYQRIFSGPGGIDPYAAAVSDIYQDLYGEGSYTGKGIYEVDAFEAALANRVPENALLSHDLFEGLFARAGLVTDVELFEEFPSHYEVAAARQHRWARGDWQLLPWILGRGRLGRDGAVPSSVPLIGRWKMLDNLRRTLSAPAVLVTLLGGWTLPFASPGLWTLFVLGTIAIPPFIPFLAGLWPRRSGISKRSHIRAVASDFLLASAQTSIAVTLIAHQASLMTDGIARTLVRLYLTRRGLLQWVTAAQAKAGSSLDLTGFYRRMRAAPSIAGVASVLVAVVRPEVWPAAAPFLLLWAASPAIARWISLPIRPIGARLVSADDARVLRSVARRTWLFFETFVGIEDHHLPPDNFQEEPRTVVAHRTSPTNLGLYLLATVAARDFGWVGITEVVQRLADTLGTLGSLEQSHGHLYNWYDTQTLRPLEPRYVSSVDSGNLAGHLVTLRQACLDMMDSPLFGLQVLLGMDDTVLTCLESVRSVVDGRRRTVTQQHLDAALVAMRAKLEPVPRNPYDWANRLAELDADARTIANIAHTLGEELGEGARSQLTPWVEAVRRGIGSHSRDLDLLAPWARLLVSDAVGGPARTAMARLFTPFPTLAAMPGRCQAAVHDLREILQSGEERPQGRSGIEALINGLDRGTAAAAALADRLATLGEMARQLVEAMQFDFLFDRTRKLFSIGYRVSDSTLDPSCYDLLASEARLTSFIAIAKGDAPPSHWFRLGRALTPVNRGSALVSWSGSMFEYLMPLLVMRSPTGSLLDQTYRMVVGRQIQYGQERRVPWGISESAYNARDLEMTYQYSNFGVPGLGLDRGLSEDLVVAPYATALAAMVDPAAAARNCGRLTMAHAQGPYGFYEALDYTGRRLLEGEQLVVVRSYMAHHQGMSIVALANALLGGIMRNRFHAEPMVQSAELLLQERVPRDVLVARPRAEEVKAAAHVREIVPTAVRRFRSPHDATPRAHLLSNGRYAVMITTAGSGYSRWGALAVTRWREDVTRDQWGTYVYLRDTQTGEVWSAAYQPTGVEPESYDVAFSEHRVEILRRDSGVATALEIVVSPEDDAELRHVSLTNLGTRVREIEVTSYAEVVLAPPAAEAAHPAFANLFVQTEGVPALGAVLATRRRRTLDEPEVWLAHVAAVDATAVGVGQYETDRGRFLGRGQGVRTAVALVDGHPLSNTAGAVLDPIVSLRRRVRIPPGATARITFTTLIAPSREAALVLADKYRDAAIFERAATLAWTHAQVQLHHFGIGPDEAHVYQRLANRVLYGDATLRAPEALRRDGAGQSALWAHGISGDLPLVVLRLDDPEQLFLVRQLVSAHEYWETKQLAVDLVILNEKPPSYDQDTQASLETMVRVRHAMLHHEGHAPHGNVYVLRGDLVSAEARDALLRAARAVLVSGQGELADQIVRVERLEPVPPPPRRREGVTEAPAVVSPARFELEFFNGLGGFAEEGREYVTLLRDGQWTPGPWINVVANPQLGFQVSESGCGYTWCINSRENQLTPWSNDPVGDSPGEALYIRDEESGEVWSPTPLPVREGASFYVARHGQGYSRFEHVSHGISLNLAVFVPPEDPVKLWRLTVENLSFRPRRLSLTAYAEWVLGASRSATGPFVVTEVDPTTGAIFARNSWNEEARGRVAFADMGGRQTAWTGDRTEFIGRNGTLDYPAALARGERLSGRVGSGLDPCAALQTLVELRPGERIEVVFMLGEGADAEEARWLIDRYRTADLNEVLQEVAQHWDDVCGAVVVKTPERAMDILLNRWLLYQTLSCRLWARSGFYQASGAYGFRDQLQDVLALLVARPDIAREHLLRAAARQFIEGDVQHWWHPPSGRGVRTRISDDLLWLPYAVLEYLRVTQDVSILDEAVPFLEGPLLAEDQHESYFQPTVSDQAGTLFEHCARAIDRSLRTGSHGLPLMGTGDWNDGMNNVGRAGKGESVWLGWFLHAILADFSGLADSRGERARADRWRKQLGVLKEGLEGAWDGDWYRRAYFDDGTPLGSASNDECRIDSIAQSWAVLSGAADPARAERAMESVDQHLVRRGDGLVLLFMPPLDRTALEPGYIKGYPPGIRENGGQYTHAALWAVAAFAALGEGDRAAELFSMLNPINQAGTGVGVHRYKVEPYVAPADIYAEPGHVGRGGWTWYTGAAGWMYRVGIEWILGLRLRGSTLFIDPCIPTAWPGFAATFRHRSSRYEISVENPHGVARGVAHAEVDGKRLEGIGAAVPLVDDGATHQVRVVLG